MGREGKWSGLNQYPQGTQPSGYVHQNMQSHAGAPGGEYALGVEPMQPGATTHAPPGPPPSQFGNTILSSRPPGPHGPSYSTPPPAARPPWAGPSGLMAGPLLSSGILGSPSNAGPLDHSPSVNRSYGGSPAGGPPQMRPQVPAPTNSAANAPRGMTAPPPGQLSTTKSSNPECFCSF